MKRISNGVVITGRTETRRGSDGHRRRWIEVTCAHGITKWVRLRNTSPGYVRWKQYFEKRRQDYLPKKGEIFGELTATGRHRYRRKKSGRPEAEVICRHNRKRYIRVGNLKSGNTASCLQWKECLAPKKGQRFGELIATGAHKVIRKRHRHFQVRCKHGVTKWVDSNHLKSKQTRSCRLWKQCRSPSHRSLRC